MSCSPTASLLGSWINCRKSRICFRLWRQMSIKGVEGQHRLLRYCKLTYRGVLEIERNPHFGAAIQRRADGSGMLRFRCPPHEFDWLTRYFLGLGLDAQVLAPDELEQRIKQTARQIVANYEKR